MLYWRQFHFSFPLSVRLFLLGGLLLQSHYLCQMAVAAPVARPPAYVAVRAGLFDHLEKQAGAKATLPDFPSQKLLVWIDGRHAQAISKDSAVRYSVLFEHLLIAQKLLESNDVSARKLGFWIASESANFAAAYLKNDKAMLAQIYEGFLLPRVSLANIPLSQDPSRSRILEAGVSAFGNAGQRDKQIRVLEWMISIGDKTAKPVTKTDPDSLTLDPNSLDWARGTLAALLFQNPKATRPEWERALTLLQAIESPDMKGFKHLEKQVQTRLEQTKQPKDQPTP